MARKPKVITDEISADLAELLTLNDAEVTPEVTIPAVAEAPAVEKVAPVTTVEDAPPAVEVAPAPVEAPVEVAPAPVVEVRKPYLSRKTLAEMEAGRSNIARYKA